MPEIMGILLKDRTTGGNIIWATDSYASFGKGYFSKDIITTRAVCNGMGNLIKPRASKLMYEQETRTRDRAEVFTPTWIIKKQNDLIEEEFRNLELNEYINKTWLEIACGEAPYIASRYDTVTGDYIEIDKRVGFLDRKIQRISKEIKDHEEWMKLVQEAYKASYGYEFQGDSLLLARENLLYTFMDYYLDKFDEISGKKDIKEIARIISYNIFQMDGLNYTIPLSEEIEKKNIDDQLSMFADENQKQQTMEFIKEGTSVKIKNWEDDKLIDIKEGLKDKGEMSMKFDVVIGNPPYQENIEGRGEQPPIYHDFYDSVKEISDIVTLVTPARFLFDAGKTPSRWNRKMLEDPHFKVVDYYPNSRDVFDSVEIKGGVAISLWNAGRHYGAIETFVPNPIVRRILKKVKENSNNYLSDILYSNTSYRYNKSFYEENIGFSKRVSGGSIRYLISSVFDRFPEVFYLKKPKSKDKYIQIIGRKNYERVTMYFPEKYLNPPENFKKYKVYLASSNGSGVFGERLSDPILGEPNVGATETFVSFGNFESKTEANNLIKYIKCKLTRLLLGTKKVTQGNKSRKVWSNVALQDFSRDSDIDWSQSIPDIDQQLYKKYNLDDEEIEFIEKNIKEME